MLSCLCLLNVPRVDCRFVSQSSLESGDAVVMTWDAQTGKHLRFYPDLTIYSIAWAPDDTRFVNAIEITDVEVALAP